MNVCVEGPQIGVRKRKKWEESMRGGARPRVLAVSALLLSTSVALAEDEFYKGKTITVVTSTGPGGTYDLTARSLSRHMPRYLPGAPNMVVQNMPGGGNVLATNFMYNIAPKDGTAIATLHNAMPLHQTLGGQGVRFDATKFTWLGSLGAENSGVIVWAKSGLKTFEDLKKRDVILGGTGAGSGIVIFPQIMNSELGTRFKIVTGYRTSDEVNIAMERGEVEARTLGLVSLLGQNVEWIEGGKVNVLAQIGARRDKRLANVPLLQELTNDVKQKQLFALMASPTAIGKPFTGPPGLPPERYAMLRTAFEAMVKDRDFLDEMQRLKIDIDPMSGDEIAAIVRDTVAAPADVVERAKLAMEADKK
jgi:tripartite-type tricarboxylate transporter receptor subunit TctC